MTRGTDIFREIEFRSYLPRKEDNSGENLL